MTSWITARVVHVLGVVLWIGGLAMVTTVLLPAARRLQSARERVEFFEQIVLIQRLHWFLLAISLVTIAAAVAGAHGGLY